MKPIRLLAATAVIMIIFTGAAAAAQNAYLKFVAAGNAVDGYDTGTYYECLSFSWGETNESGEPEGPGTLHATLVSADGKKSALKRLYESKAEIPEIVFTSGEGRNKYEIRLIAVQVKSYQVGGSADRPTEEVAFYYIEIK